METPGQFAQAREAFEKALSVCTEINNKLTERDTLVLLVSSMDDSAAFP